LPLGLMLVVPTELTGALDDHLIWPETEFSMLGYGTGGVH